MQSAMIQISMDSITAYHSKAHLQTIISIPGRRQSKTLILTTNVDQKSLKTEFLIAICRPTGDKWQSKTLFLAISDPLSSIVKGVFDCRLSGVIPLWKIHLNMLP